MPVLEKFGWGARVVFVTGIALLLSLLLEPLIEPDFSPLFLGAVLLCTWRWRVRAGISSAALAVPSLLLLFLPPHYTLSLWSLSTLSRELSFIATATLIMWLVNRFRKAEGSLRASLEDTRAREELFCLALKKSPVVVFHQYADLRYSWVYNPFAEHVGMSLVNKLDSDLFPPGEAEQLNRLKRGVLASGKGAREELVFMTEGRPRTMDILIEPFRDSSGKLAGLLGTAVDVTDRKRNEQELQNSREQLRGLVARLQATREEERALTSHEVHDIGQVLAALELHLFAIAGGVPDGADSGAVAGRLKEITQLLAATIESSARISRELRPSLLDHLGLAVALDWQAREFASRTGIHVMAEPLEEVSLPPEVGIAVFRIAQDALANVERHAHATEILLTARREDNTWVLRIQDNGRGITQAEIADPRSFGLFNMRELALSFGGRFDIQGVPGRGTTVSLEIPVDARMSRAPSAPAALEMSAVGLG